VAAMILFPAIDLKDGVCVRLYKGIMEQATIFNNDPLDQALQFQSMGFEWLHIVDLNGAFAGKPINAEIVKQICKETSIPVQLGGGIRSLETIEFWLSHGVKRVILGTVAVKDPSLVKEACKAFPNKIVVGIDAKEGFVATEGWADVSELQVIDLAKKFEDCGVSSIIYTDISRDGALTGVNIDSTVSLAKAVHIPIIASGGVSDLEDLRKLKEVEHYGIEGVISGRAIYDGRINPQDALDLLKTSHTV
jgi:phosphoribosylformimino-5-aminoimidazole carboxamide ribotide isomerase